jgi:hypothetical protein
MPKRDRDEDDEDRKRRKAEKKEKKKSQKKEDKKERKEHETESERRARKEKKKAAKLASFFGYTNEENPFGDTSLQEQFVWRKKHTKEGTDELVKKAKEKKREKLVNEIVKVRKRRQDREDEREEMDRLKQEELRLREAAQYGDWQAKEEEFLMKSTQERSRIRIREGREKPIDILAKNLLIFQGGEDDGTKDSRKGTTLDPSLEMELREPYKIFEQLPLSELKELHDDIKTYLEFEGGGTNAEFWASLKVICEHELKQLEADAEPHHGTGMHASVAKDVEEMFAGKSCAHLEGMQSEIADTLEGGADDGVDVEYWEGLLAQLIIYKAKAKLRELHTQILMGRLEQLAEKKKKVQAQREEEAAAKGESVAADDLIHQLEGADGDPSLSPELEAGGEDFSPVLEEDDGDNAVDEEEDKQGLEEQRRLALEQQLQKRIPQSGPGDVGSEADAMFRREASKGVDDGEEVMAGDDEFSVPGQVYWWHDKYRPRKPRYFNRVKTGYEWNKYNQTHYDHDNPPPKVVQGYKFNIFYPDLLDKSKTPNFVIEPGGHKDFCIIRFKAGPPYEDLAFKIVNKEWEYAQKRGFRCVFERGILQLYFNFKRHMYRR